MSMSLTEFDGLNRGSVVCLDANINRSSFG
jgi:hypothetical protein